MFAVVLNFWLAVYMSWGTCAWVTDLRTLIYNSHRLADESWFSSLHRVHFRNTNTAFETVGTKNERG